MSRPIALLTDFGTRDPFVGIMKCVIATIAPRAVVIDLAHDLPPQDVRAGAFALACAHPFLPPRAVVVAVVDPGVGTERRAIAVETSRALYVAPDNGLLSMVLRDDPARKIVELRERRFFLESISSTFHGRDVFAPVGAHLARGVPLAKLGPRLLDCVRLELRAPQRSATRAHGEVLAIDRYGNAITNVPNDWASIGDAVRVRGRIVAKLARAYGDVEEGRALAVRSSGGTVEIAVRGGNAAKTLRLAPGDAVEVAPSNQRRR